MLTKIEKNSAVSGERYVLTAYGFFLVVRLASMQIKSGLLKSLFPKNSGLTLKIYIDPKCMTSRVSSKNKEKKAKRKNRAKKRPNRKKKNGTKKQKTVSPGVEPGLSAGASNSLTTAPQ